MPAFTLQQKTFVFSMIANAAAQMKNAKESDLQKAVKDRFDEVTFQNTKYLGTGWTLEWGPIVQELGGSGVADNTMFVTKGTEGGNPVYIVAIAGTNAISAFDIQTEDLEVANLIPFGSTGTTVAQGTRLGVDVLETLVAGTGVLKLSRKTLQQYLTDVAAKNATLIFTGHSLGGALAPTLALDLAVNLGFDLTKWGAVYVYPSAGPTPGDKAFANLFAQRFPATGTGPTGSWNRNIANSIDAVPRAWNQLNTIREIYKPDLEGTSCIGLIVTALIANRGIINKYENLATEQFVGTYNKSLTPPSHPDDDSVKFVVQVFYQHIAAYVVALIPEFSSVFPPASLPASATDGIYNKCHSTV